MAESIESGQGEARMTVPVAEATSTELPDTPTPRMPSSVRLALNGLAILVFLFAVVVALLFIHRFAVNMIYYDQWADVDLIRHAHNGTLSFGELWAQHNENRIFFPNLVVLLLAYTTHFNVVTEVFLSGVLLIAATALLIVAHKRRSPAVPLIWYGPVALVLLSLIAVEPLLFGFLICWTLVLVALAAALYLLDRPDLTSMALSGAVVAAVVGSYSCFEGLFIWPAGLVLLYLRRRSRSHLLVWIASGFVTGVLFFIHFDFVATAGKESSVLQHPVVALEFFFSSIGNVVGTQFNTPTAQNSGVLLLGILIFVIAVWALIQGFHRTDSGGSPIGVALICFGLLFVAFITLGRSQLGLASASRFSTWELTIWVGAYLALLGRPARQTSPYRSRWMDLLNGWKTFTQRQQGGPDGAPAWARPFVQLADMVVCLVLALCILLQLTLGSEGALLNARGWRGEEISIADVTANIPNASDPLIQNTLGAYSPDFLREMAAFAKSDRLSLFATGSAADYSRQGLFPSLLISVTGPLPGGRMSGTEVLGANVLEAGATPTSARVQFHLSGTSQGDAVIATATPTFYGWLARWDSSTVPDGVYRLRAVLQRSGRADTSSAPVIFVVANRGRRIRVR
jgi:hypothetical protein